MRTCNRVELLKDATRGSFLISIGVQSVYEKNRKPRYSDSTGKLMTDVIADIFGVRKKLSEKMCIRYVIISVIQYDIAMSSSHFGIILNAIS